MLVAALLLTFLSLFSLRHSSWHPSITALFHPPVETSALSAVPFASTAHLSLVIEGDNPETNRQLMERLLQPFRNNPQLGFALHSLDSSLVANHYLLYFNLSEIEEFRNTIQQIAAEKLQQKNLFVVDLLNDAPAPISSQQLERWADELLPPIQSRLESKNGKLLIAHIFPPTSIETSLDALQFVEAIQQLVRQLQPSDVKVHFTGELFQLAAMEEIHSRELPKQALWSVVAAALLLLVFFFRQPMIPLVALLPVFVGLLWILALNNWIVGAITPLTLLLLLLFFTFGVGLVAYLLGRYEEERLKGLGPKLSLETVLLETGPAVVLGSWMTAIGFVILIPIPFKGYSDFGWVGGGATLLMMVAILVLFPAMLQWLQRRRPFSVAGITRSNLLPFQRSALRVQTLALLTAAVALLLTALYQLGIPLTYEKELQGIGLISRDDRATELMKQADLFGEGPLVLHTADSASAARTAQQLSRWGSSKKLIYPAVFHSGQLLPTEQKEKLALFSEIEQELDSATLSQLPSRERRWAELLLQRLPRQPLTIEQLPQQQANLLRPRKGSHLVLALPRFSLEDGMQAARLARGIDSIATLQSAYATGTALYLGRFVDQSLSKMPWTQIIALAAMLLLLAFEVGWRRTLRETILPVAIGILTALTLIFQSSAGLNPVNVLLLPFLFGLIFNNVIQVQYRFHEEGEGSLPYVLRTSGQQVAISTAITFTVFFPLLFSQSQLLQTIAIAIISGTVGSASATFIVSPWLLGAKERFWGKGRFR